MDYYYIIIIFVFLKILFWSFYFYVRAQRIRQARAQQRIVVVDRRVVTCARPITVHRAEDHSGIIHQEYLPQGFVNPTGPQEPTLPPSYNEVVNQDPGQFQKPPSYEQVVNNTANQENTSDIPSPNPVYNQ